MLENPDDLQQKQSFKKPAKLIKDNVNNIIDPLYTGTFNTTRCTKPKKKARIYKQ